MAQGERPIPRQCGAGKGPECCIFLTCGADGFECMRATSLDAALRRRQPTMHARRIPTEPYPDCMLPTEQ